MTRMPHPIPRTSWPLRQTCRRRGGFPTQQAWGSLLVGRTAWVRPGRPAAPAQRVGTASPSPPRAVAAPARFPPGGTTLWGRHRPGQKRPNTAARLCRTVDRVHETQQRRSTRLGPAGQPVARPDPAPAHAPRPCGSDWTARPAGRAAVLHRSHGHHPRGPRPSVRRGEDGRTARDAPHPDRRPYLHPLRATRRRVGRHARPTTGTPDPRGAHHRPHPALPECRRHHRRPQHTGRRPVFPLRGDRACPPTVGSRGRQPATTPRSSPNPARRSPR